MRICRFSLKSGEWHWGELDANRVWELRQVSSDPVSFIRSDREFPPEQCRFQIPFIPTQLVGIGDNFRKGAQDSKTPVIFQKPLSSVVPNRSVVLLPEDADVWGEPEIGIVLKRSCSNLSEFKPADYILGYCLINDTTAQFRSHSHSTHDPEAKGQPGFCQVGEFIITDFTYESAMITGKVNGKDYRKGSTAMMKWDLKKVLVEVTKNISLNPFDVIFTGCPERVSNERTFLQGGEEFRVEVAGLGELITTYERKI